MIRLQESPFTFDQIINACILGITGNDQLKCGITISAESLKELEELYISAAKSGQLYTIEHVDTGNSSLRVNSLDKDDLIKLYKQYFSSKGKPAYKIYDAILNAAKGSCPYCGGIGTPRNLDHYLPKTFYPQFSILPGNLIPSCRDCNMDGKSQKFSTSANNQVIQPYFDNERFFSDQWIFSTYIVDNYSNVGQFRYYVSPPDSWPEIDKQRASKHFNDFDISTRYSRKAAELLSMVLVQIKSMEKENINATVIQSTILQPGIDTAQFANHWQKGMYQALSTYYLGDSENQ